MLFESGVLRLPDKKTCYRCKQTKPAKLFGVQYATKDGLSTECKQCVSDRSQRSGRRERREALFVSGELRLPSEKACYRCNRTKSADCFNVVYTTKDGLSNWCKQCTSEWTTKSNKRRKYGMDDKAIIAMLGSQGDQCPICLRRIVFGERKNNFHIDHDHETGAIRGILCETCNPGLGKLNDDPARLAMGVAYLIRTLPLNTPKTPGPERPRGRRRAPGGRQPRRPAP